MNNTSIATKQINRYPMIQSNISKVNELTSIVENHPLGGSLSIIINVTYIFHEDHCGLHGIRVSLDKGKIHALTTLINKLDEIYNSEFSWSSHHTDLKSL